MTGSLKLIWIKTINKCNGLLDKPRLKSRLIDNKKREKNTLIMMKDLGQ